jgi:hypothetical protein
MDFKGARPTYLGTNLVKTNDTFAGSHSDVAISGSAAAQGLIWDGTNWVNGRTTVVNQPADDGFLTRNYDQSVPGQSVSSTGTAGVLYLARVELPDRALTVTNMHFILGAVAVTITNAFIGIYDSGGTQRMVSANQAATGAWTSLTAPLKTVAGTSTWSKAATANAFCWIALLTNPAATMPGFQRAINSTTSNGLLAVSAARWGTILSGQNSLPASITPANIAFTSVTNWVALS